MFDFFKNTIRETEQKEFDFEYHVLIDNPNPNKNQTSTTDHLELIKNKLIEREKQGNKNKCSKIYPLGNRSWTILKDIMMIGSVIGIFYASKILFDITAGQVRKDLETKWHYENDIRYNNKTCFSLISPYTDLWHWCRGDSGNTPEQYLRACFDLRYCGGMEGPAFGGFVLIIGILVCAAFYIKSRYEQRNNWIPAMSLINSAEKQMLVDNGIEVTSHSSVREVVLRIEARIIQIKYNLNRHVLSIVEEYLNPHNQSDHPALHYLALMKQ